MTITKSGVYDISAEEYHADPCPEPSLSSSILRIIMAETPRHAWTAHPRLNPNFEAEEEGSFDLGNAAHSLMLGDPKKFAVCDFDDWRTKDAKAMREQARIEGKIPLLAKHWDRVQAMVEAGRRQLEAHHDAADAFTKGKPEQTLIWQEGDIWCRARLDWLPDDTTGFFDDFKSTGSANPDVFQRIAYSLGHDIQAGFYRRGLRAVLGLANPRIRFIVQEVEEPFALSAIDLNTEAMDLADYKLERGIDRWRWCMQNKSWPGYPARTCTIGPPTWHENQVLQKEEAEAGLARQTGGKPTQAILSESLRWQSPDPKNFSLKKD